MNAPLIVFWTQQTGQRQTSTLSPKETSATIGTLGLWEMPGTGSPARLGKPWRMSVCRQEVARPQWLDGWMEHIPRFVVTLSPKACSFDVYGYYKKVLEYTFILFVIRNPGLIQLLPLSHLEMAVTSLTFLSKYFNGTSHWKYVGKA